MINKRTALISAATALTLTAPMLAGCGGPDVKPGATALVIGYHRNAQKPALVEASRTQLLDALSRGDKLYVVSVSGASSLKASDSLKCPYSTTEACKQYGASVVPKLLPMITKYPADQPEADLLGGINIARDAIASAEGPKHIIVIDNGVSTAGALQLLNLEILDGDLASLAEDFASKGFTHSLKGYDVLFTGLGQAADEQKAALPEPYPQKVQQLWKDVAIAAGANSVDVDVTPLPARDSSINLPAVAVAKLKPVIPPEPCNPFDVTADRLGFVGDEATLRDPEASANVLRSIAARLKKSGLTIMLTGTTAYAETTTGVNSLSNRRARAVKDVLVRLGVAQGKILTQGVGINWPGYVPPNGNPQKEREMRLVIFNVICPGK